MKKFKFLIWFVIALGIAVFIFSNKAFFLSSQAYTLNLLFKEYNLGEVTNWMLFVSCFIAGIILAYIFSFPVRMRLRREIKTLNAANNSHLEMIASLKKELEGFKAPAEDVAGAAAETVPPGGASGPDDEETRQTAETQPQEKA